MNELPMSPVDVYTICAVTLVIAATWLARQARIATSKLEAENKNNAA